jgi:hypothetical protein
VAASKAHLHAVSPICIIKHKTGGRKLGIAQKRARTELQALSYAAYCYWTLQDEEFYGNQYRMIKHEGKANAEPFSAKRLDRLDSRKAGCQTS